ncbi:MAG: UvrD-helicase domain-containing protein [Rhodothermales bacterium]|nr:UvrD-helicase domain-containing protein [Rhodothermales bacterium]MDG2015983.1 UvrD-helicase domain-containing protein [Rhodothermales bacterium]
MTAINPKHTVPVDEPIRCLLRGSRDFTVPISSDMDFVPNKTIIVRAGAGSGKTTVLVKRMLSLLRGGSAPDEIVAITFTKKAAGELRQRFFEGLMKAQRHVEERIQSDSEESAALWAQEKERLDEAVRHAEDVFIGTIHSFCARLLRQRALSMGLPADFEQIDDRDEERLRLEFWNSFMEAAEGDGRDTLRTLKKAEIPSSALFDLFGVLSGNSTVQFEGSGSIKPSSEGVFQTLKDYLNVLEPLLPEYRKKDALLSALLSILNLMESGDQTDPFFQVHLLKLLKKAYKDSDNPEFAVTLNSWGASKSAGHTLAGQLKKGKEELGKNRSLLEFVGSDVMPFVEKWEEWINDMALNFAGVAVDAYRKMRFASGKLTYEDLLTESMRLLKEDAVSRSHFQEKYRHILVDEFQDTDPVQAAMLFYLCSIDPDQKDWSESTLIPGRLFLVGDDKQSIYRFRKADFQAFHLVRESIRKQNGLDLKLSVNFRSDERICNWINRTVSGLFTAQDAPFQAPWEDLNAWKGRLPDELAPDEPAIVTIRMGDLRYVPKEPRLIAECHAFSEHISRLRASSGLKFEDFLILVRTASNIPFYVSQLSRAGIPVGVTGGAASKMSDALVLISDVLRCLYDPNNGVALVATLRSRLFGVSDQDLFDYVSAGYQLEALVEAQEEGPAHLARSAELLRKARTCLFELAPADAFERVMVLIGLESAMQLAEEPDLAKGMMLKVGAMFRDWQQQGYTIGRCVEELELYRRETLKMEAFSASAPMGNSVRIMTVHQAKGLQAEVVFLADPGSKQSHPATLHTLRDGPNVSGKAVLKRKFTFRSEILARPAGWAHAEDLENQFSIAEEMRLIYVACTRACRQLVISTGQEKSKKGIWDPLYAALSAPEVAVITLSSSATPVVAALDTEAPEKALTFDVAQRIAALSEPSIRFRRPSESKQEGSSAPSGRKGPGQSLGKEFGAGVHALFESIVGLRKQKPDEAEVRRRAEQAIRFRDIHSAQTELINTAVGAAMTFLESDLWTELEQAQRVLTEVPFTVLYSDSGIEEVVSGVTDLAFRTDSGWTIVDYKTDNAGDEELVARHSAQVTEYVKAWKQIFPDQRCAGYLWSTRSGAYLPITEME